MWPQQSHSSDSGNRLLVFMTFSVILTCHVFGYIVPRRSFIGYIDKIADGKCFLLVFLTTKCLHNTKRKHVIVI
jgi:hypothetical protein